jgi:transcriptional regulator with XRE-family HTH domain
MKNPITEVREELGLSRRQFALAAGVGYAELWRSEAGYARSLHPEVIQFLKQKGYAGDPESEYACWREELGNIIRSGVNNEQLGSGEGPSVVSQRQEKEGM